ncbi:HD domain-containing protein [Chryseobacterium gwangjuense]|uniref:HD domain-containing protein n=1 Tax=Chryseobacterium gwangjuense TaxID=1069980 RepID=UPI001E45C767|nr:ATP-binding protein [Chryseobacterium gwangjuense]MCE3075893.1 ATP-binding protein [Chryseobacterium gwangjuense]
MNQLLAKSFDSSVYNYPELIDKLLLEIKKSELNLCDNLEKIREDFPNLTDHSLAHSIALWNYAQIIIGNDNYLNPLEAYVLHICFLIHDAGMCFSILNNKNEIIETEIFKDFIALNPDLEDLEFEALFYCVRKLHGEFALKIPQTLLSSGKMVIEDEELRDEFSEIIGKISKSHSCDISYIENELNTYVNPRFVDLKVDCKKLAFILRVSDAAHIDNLRTPLTKKQIQEDIKGISKEHWTFQKKIGFPTVENGFLIYNSNSKFEINEKKAWWLCYEALKVLDSELRKADTFFTESNKNGFLVKGVKNIENTLRLGESNIRTSGWKSLDSKVKVTNPKLLAANVGGKNLYGSIHFAFREILQNSIDAINIRKLKDENFHGLVEVSLEQNDNDHFLIIKDNGIGMSRNIMVNQLLDFGNSYWNSYDFYDEYVGVARLKFKSIGKFGIGFFSVFMLGDFIEVDSVKYGEVLTKRHKLTFENGLYDNPILSEYDINDVKNDYGTIIKIKLKDNPYSKEGFIGTLNLKNNNLLDFIKFLIPSVDFDIKINEYNNLVVYKNYIDDSRNYSYGEIISELSVEKNNETQKIISVIKSLPLYLLPIKVDGIIIGQLGVLPNISQISPHETGVVISNGVRVSTFSNDLIGYVKVDEISNLNRTKFKSNIPFTSFYEWGVRILEYINSHKDLYDFTNKIDGLKFTLGIIDEDQQIFGLILNNKNVYGFTVEQFKNYIKNINEIKIYTLMQGIGNGYNYDGFIFLVRPLSFGDLLKSADNNKINTSEKFVEDLILQVWSGFTTSKKSGLEEFALTNNFRDIPYMELKTYNRKFS